MVYNKTLERERGGRKKKVSFFGDFMRFYRSELGRTRVKAALRDESYAWVPESQDLAKVQGLGFHGNREKACVPGNHAI